MEQKWKQKQNLERPYLKCEPQYETGNEQYIKASTNVIFKGVRSQYLELFWPCTKLPLNRSKLENNSLLRIEKHLRDTDKPTKEQGWYRMEKINTDCKRRT